MMDFSLDPAEVELAASARKFCEERILPRAKSWDIGEPIDRSVFAELGDVGLLSLRLPEEHGGLGASYVACGNIAYEVGRADIGLAIMVVNAVMWGELYPLMSPSIREKWTPRIAQGAPFVITLTEPGAGSDAGSIRTTAKRDGDSWVINGEKGSATYTGLGEICLCFARTGGPGAKGISSIMIPWDAPGIEKRVYDSVGERVTQRGQVYYNDVRVPLENLVGEENGGFLHAMRFFDYNRAFLTLMCIGAAEKSLDETIEYLKIREAFGKPLAAFQGVNFQIAEHMTRLEAAKLLCYKVLWLKDQGIPHSKEAAMVKWLGIEEAYRTTHTCLLMHGWPAYSSDLPFDKRMRDIMGLQLGDGTREIMKMVIAREVFGREALPYHRSSSK